MVKEIKFPSPEEREERARKLQEEKEHTDFVQRLKEARVPNEMDRFVSGLFSRLFPQRTKKEVKARSDSESLSNINGRYLTEHRFPSYFGLYTFDPAESRIDYIEKSPQIEVRSFEELRGKSRRHVWAEIIRKFYPQYGIAGLHYYKYLTDLPSRVPRELMNGKHTHFFGSVLYGPSGEIFNLCVTWGKPDHSLRALVAEPKKWDTATQEISRFNDSLEAPWGENDQVLLIRKINEEGTVE